MPGLILYVRPRCSYCAQVEFAVATLGLQVELRDVWADEDARRELVENVGRASVPVLRIDGDDGTTRWIPESLDIIRDLEARVGLHDRTPRWLDRILGVSPAWTAPAVLAGFVLPAPAGPTLQALAVVWLAAALLRRGLVLRRVGRHRPTGCSPGDDHPQD